jgi:hypothetical protein
MWALEASLLPTRDFVQKIAGLLLLSALDPAWSAALPVTWVVAA